MGMQTIIDDLMLKNTEFFNLIMKALQFNEYTWSVIPSVLFLIFGMYFLHRLIERSVGSYGHGIRDEVFREISYQWILLYITRGWFYVIKAYRITNNYLLASAIKSGGSELNLASLQSLSVIILLIASLIPFFLILLTNENETASLEFVLWQVNRYSRILRTPTNRWARTELGHAGRLMQRPPDFKFTEPKTRAYRTKRSTSTEMTNEKSIVDIPRYCKSFFFNRPVSTIEDIIAPEPTTSE